MKMADFKALTLSERLTKLNAHLLSLKSLEGRLEDNFKRGEFDFSYSLLKKNAADLGMIVDGKNYVAYGIGDEPPIQTNVINQTSNNDVVKQTSLTNEEIAFLKQLYAQSQRNQEQLFLLDDKPMLVVPVMTGEKKTTSISVYIEQWERWNTFKQRHSMYSGTDLLAMAIEDFLEKYDNED